LRSGTGRQQALLSVCAVAAVLGRAVESQDDEEEVCTEVTRFECWDEELEASCQKNGVVFPAVAVQQECSLVTREDCRELPRMECRDTTRESCWDEPFTTC